jgi:hypothetical protein
MYLERVVVTYCKYSPGDSQVRDPDLAAVDMPRSPSPTVDESFSLRSVQYGRKLGG